MKRFHFAGLALVVALLLPLAPAQADPIGGIISYQGKLTNPDRTPLTDGVYNVTFTFYENGANTGVSQTSMVNTIGGVFSIFLSVGALNFKPANSYDLVVVFNNQPTPFHIASVPVSQTATTVADGAITTAKIAVGAVGDANIVGVSATKITGQLQGGQIANNSIGDNHIVSVSAGKVLGQVGSGQIADGSVTLSKLALNAAGPGYIPVGGVIMWWSDGSVPTGWAVCDGSIINSPASPLNGRALPDLRNKFVRGVGNSDLRTTPVSGGSDVDDHTHSISTDGNHKHTVDNHTHAIWLDGQHSHSIAVDNNARQLTGTGGSGIWVSDASHSHGALTGGAGNHDHRGSTQGAQPGTDYQGNHSHGGATGPSSTSGTQNNVPAYVGLVYIIRVF